MSVTQVYKNVQLSRAALIEIIGALAERIQQAQEFISTGIGDTPFWRDAVESAERAAAELGPDAVELLTLMLKARREK